MATYSFIKRKTAGILFLLMEKNINRENNLLCSSMAKKIAQTAQNFRHFG